jgi:hypothetical protein
VAEISPQRGSDSSTRATTKRGVPAKRAMLRRIFAHMVKVLSASAFIPVTCWQHTVFFASKNTTPRRAGLKCCKMCVFGENN